MRRLWIRDRHRIRAAAILEHYEENFAERLEREKKAAPKGDPQFRAERSARVMRLQWLYSPRRS